MYHYNTIFLVCKPFSLLSLNTFWKSEHLFVLSEVSVSSVIECFLCLFAPFLLKSLSTLCALTYIYGEGQMLNSWWWSPHYHSAAPQTSQMGKEDVGSFITGSLPSMVLPEYQAWSKKSQSSVKLSWLTGLCWELYVLHRADTGCRVLCRGLSEYCPAFRPGHRSHLVVSKLHFLLSAWP